jgi:pimeloyl-ACP methyl ester carboxylesterase
MRSVSFLKPDRSPVNQWRDALRAIANESCALARQSIHMPAGLWPDTPQVAAGGQAVILLHGLFATAGALRVLRDRIEDGCGLPTGSFSYPPWWGVAELATGLARFLAPLPSTVGLHLVGHSLGGLAARYYVQVSPRDPRVVQTISLGSPFAGTRSVAWIPGDLYSGLRPGSRVLRVIERTWSQAALVPHTSIAASHDLLVQPPASALGPSGAVMVVPSCGHASLLYDPRVAECVADRIRQLAPCRRVPASAA